jgi:predicted ribosomally synthesized peptide with nif11-like leader
MSSESFKSFIAKIQNDEGLKNEFRAAGGDAGMPVEAMVAFAAGKGYDFKVEDVSGDLTDKQLDSVTGGALYLKVDSFTDHKTESLSTYLSSAGSLMYKLV